MATGDSRVADLNSLWAHLFEDAVFTVREQTLATRLVKTFVDGKGDQTRQLPEYSAVTFGAVAETEDFTNPTRFSKTSLSTLTPGEVMAQILLTYRRIETDPDDAQGDASVELGRAAAQKVDSDIFSNFSSLTGGTIGTAGGTIIWGNLFAAMSRLREASVPEPYYAVMPPYHWHQLAKAAAVGATVTNAPQFQDTIMSRWYVGSTAGMDIFVSSNVETSSTDAYTAVFNPLALAFDLRRDFTIEPEKDASRRSWEINAHMLYAHGVWRPKWGVQVIADNTAPTE